MSLRRLSLVAVIVSLSGISPVAANVISVLDYNFPASASDLSLGTVTDLGSPAHNGTATNFTDAGLSTNVPTGAAAGTESVNFGTKTDGRRIGTNTRTLLKVADVAAAGGYTMDASFYVDPSLGNSTGAVIDYANTDQLKMTAGMLRFVQYGETLSYAIDSPTIATSAWHHVTAVFDSTGFSPVADPDYTGYNKIQGTMHLYLDGTQVGTGISAFFTGEAQFYDATDSTCPAYTAIGKSAYGGDDFAGLIYNPSVTLGFASAPEPGSIVLLITGLVGLLAYAWRKRK